MAVGELIAEERRFLPKGVQPGLPASIALHVILLCWGLVWFPATKPLTVPQVDALPVEIISDVSNSALGKKTAPQKEKSSLDKMIPPKERPDSKTVGIAPKDLDAPATETVTKDAVQRAVDTPPPPPPPAPPKEQPKEQPKEPPKEPPPPPTPPKVEPIKTPPPPPTPPKVEPVKTPPPPQKLETKPDPKPSAKDEKALAKLVDSEMADVPKPAKTETKPKAETKPEVKPVTPPPPTKASKASEKDALAEAQKLLEPSKSTSQSTTPSKATKFDPGQLQALLNKQQSSGGGAKANTQDAALGAESATPSATLTSSEIDALKRQIKGCWTPPDGVTAGAALWVKLEFQLNPDGTVVGTPRVIDAAPGEFQEVAAERAIAAVMGCGPYQLPAEKYDSWKSNTMRFDPNRIF